jgi:ribose 5-phosphate isomerase A
MNAPTAPFFGPSSSLHARGEHLKPEDRRKRQAAERAVSLVESGMRLGLGTGSTALHVLHVLAERLTEGELRDVAGVATSRATEAEARRLGVPLISLDARQNLDLCIDGTDEFDPHLDLVRGMGGALLWERIVADACDRVVIVADESKRVRRLGQRSPVPVEIVPFGWRTHLEFLADHGCLPRLRETEGNPFVTDGGHYIIDCRFPGGIPDPPAFQRAACQRTGVVATGLFLGVADVVVVGGEEAEAELIQRRDA